MSSLADLPSDTHSISNDSAMPTSIPSNEVGDKSFTLDVHDMIIRQPIESCLDINSNPLAGKPGRERCRRARNSKNNCYKHRMEIKEVFLDYDDLCGRVTSLQKRAVIGR